MRKFLQSPLFTLLLFSATLVACGPQACQTHLAPEGVYKSDSVLYEADNTIKTAHDVLQDFVTWEANYRSVLAQWPEIRKAADVIYREGPGWFMSALAVRDAYKANPTSDNKTKLQTAIDVIHVAIAQASQYMATAKIPPGTAPEKTATK